jgi:hypothetical protein
MLNEIPRMRKDKAIFRDLFNPKDTGWRKALVRFMRTLRAER